MLYKLRWWLADIHVLCAHFCTRSETVGIEGEPIWLHEYGLAKIRADLERQGIVTYTRME